MEPLETRRLLSGDGALGSIDFNDNVLTIQGTPNDDIALVTMSHGDVVAKLTYVGRGSWHYFARPRAVVHRIVFRGEDGNDQFINNTDVGSVAEGGNGIDRLRGGSGKDVLYGDEQYAGGKVVGNGAGATAPHPQPQDDVLVGGAGMDRLYGGIGRDRLYGQGGSDVLVGDRDDDYLDGGDSDDIVYGGSGDDIASGGAGRDHIDGGTGRDFLWGGSGDDIIVGNSGNDWISGGYGGDYIVGGPDFDVINGDEGALPPFGFGVPEGDWRGIGMAGNDTLFGGTGVDHIYAGGGDDIVFGGFGDDLLIGGSGRDHLYGGLGTDHVYGGSGDDFLFGGEGSDFLYGEDGSDQLNGGFNADYLSGGDDQDILYGGFDTVEDAVFGDADHDYFLYLAGTQPKDIKDGYIGKNNIWAVKQVDLDKIFAWTKITDPWAGY